MWNQCYARWYPGRLIERIGFSRSSGMDTALSQRLRKPPSICNSRKLNSLEHYFPQLVETLSQLDIEPAIDIDGEVVVLDAEGRSGSCGVTPPGRLVSVSN